MGIKLTTESFIERANQIHDSVYDYSKSTYTGYYKKLCIIDLIHGEFWQKPNDHLAGCGNPNLYPNKKITTKEFIERAAEIHGDLYDYTKVKYKGHHTKICIIDLNHGEFFQRPSAHLLGHGCPARTCNDKTAIHKDHIIPISILGSRFNNKIDRNRPLFKYLNSGINIQRIASDANNMKSDWIQYKGKKIRARHNQNDYKIIAYLAETRLNKNIDKIIQKDKEYLLGM